MVSLAVLMPIVASMGGNAGTQTMTVAVRSLATRDLRAASAVRIVRREMLVEPFERHLPSRSIMGVDRRRSGSMSPISASSSGWRMMCGAGGGGARRLVSRWR